LVEFRAQGDEIRPGTGLSGTAVAPDGAWRGNVVFPEQKPTVTPQAKRPPSSSERSHAVSVPSLAPLLPASREGAAAAPDVPASPAKTGDASLPEYLDLEERVLHPDKVASEESPPEDLYKPGAEIQPQTGSPKRKQRSETTGTPLFGTVPDARPGTTFDIASRQWQVLGRSGDVLVIRERKTRRIQRLRPIPGSGGVRFRIPPGLLKTRNRAKTSETGENEEDSLTAPLIPDTNSPAPLPPPRVR